MRRLIRHRPAVAALIVALALSLRIVVPGGFMPMVEHGRVVVTICSGSLDGPAAMVMTMPGMEHRSDPANTATGKCAYADLAQAMTGGADPVLLLAALLFALTLVLAVAANLAPREAARLRPPVRGPPATV